MCYPIEEAEGIHYSFDKSSSYMAFPATALKIMVFCDVKLCSLADINLLVENPASILRAEVL
jgi:hypothetical protein